jgi:hypothetical protein
MSTLLVSRWYRITLPTKALYETRVSLPRYAFVICVKGRSTHGMSTRKSSFKGHDDGSQFSTSSRKTHTRQFHGQMMKVL